MLITLFFFNDTATTEIYTLSLHDALPIWDGCVDLVVSEYGASIWCDPHHWVPEAARVLRPGGRLVFLVNAWLAVLCQEDRKSTRLNSSHANISYAVFCLKKKKKSVVHIGA